MILPAGPTRPIKQSLSELGRVQRLLVRGRFLLAGVYFAGLILLIWATFFDGHLLESPLPADFTFIMVLSAIFFGMQALLLCGAPHFRWPRPTRRRWIFISLATGALMAALLTFGFITAISGLEPDGLRWMRAMQPWWVPFLIVIGLPWAFWFIMFAFVAGGPWLGRFRSMYRLLLAGTWLEVLVTVPVDVSVRRRTSCYCNEGTFFAMIIGITMVFWTFGPGVVLLFVSVRHRHQYPAGVCAHCGYDLRGLPEPRCPECGTPFEKLESAVPKTAGENSKTLPEL